ncbi:pseudouridylate synthase [Saccharothrix sp. MB29]|nr:pseudouridylate synthase [Saccharothrix sp. MB29]
MRRKQRPALLAQRHGLDPARLRLPPDGTWATVRDHLVERLPRVAPERIDAMLAEGAVHDPTGPLAPDAAYVPGSSVWFHRDPPDEVPVPFDIRVVHRDDAILVVDKPHFLATIPRGSHVVETALVRLRTGLGLPHLSPAHRLDRVTAGLVMFVVDPALRGKYQTMFKDRVVRKEYEAVAPHDPALELPRTVTSRIVKVKGVITAQEVPGPPNAETRVELVGYRGGWARYRLLP